jgi:hypothetical protein
MAKKEDPHGFSVFSDLSEDQPEPDWPYQVGKQVEIDVVIWNR